MENAQRSTISRLALIFFASGAAGLFYEVIFSKSLALTFGSTAVAATTVLATYMGGMALGSWVGGRLSPRVADPVRAYALCEVGVAVWCALSTPLLHLLRAAYAALATGSDPASPALLGLRVALGSIALLPATVLMGMTLPFLARDLLRRGRALGDAVGILYGANTLGAAVGAVAAGYLILPALGMLQTTLLAVALNLLAALLSLRIARPAVEEAAAAEAPQPAAEPGDRRLALAALAVLTVGGAITLALETLYVHLLAVVAGNSVFAFSLMLFAFLAGLGGGSTLGRRRVLKKSDLGRDLAFCELALAAVLLGGVFYWDRLPQIFISPLVGGLAATFAGREVVRFVTCAAAMIPAAFVIGVAYPIAMELVARGRPGQKVQALGRASALNTLGNVLGAIAGGFVLLPRLGSLASLHVLAAVAVVLAILPALVLARRAQLQIGAGVLAAVALFAAQPRSFDLNRLASGQNVYFAPSSRGAVIDFAESLDGGLTTVHTTGGPRPVLTLNTNGKFQGNDALGGELKAQVGFAIDSLLHTRGRDKALVIGFGTGTTTHVIERAGFNRVDVAELSADILRLAGQHFRKVNHGVLARPHVHSAVADGRNMLLLSKDRYDLVSIEITSIWFAGAASLYNREFYRIVKDHLGPHGVLQQWLQLHHIYGQDVVSVLATIRSEFPQVWLYVTGGQGIIIACPEDCPREENLHQLESGVIAQDLAAIGVSARRQLDDLMLTPADIDRMLAIYRERRDLDALVSTDDNLRLEYSTPRGNALDGARNEAHIRGMLQSFRAQAVEAGK